MTQQTISTQQRAIMPDGCITLAEIEYLLDSGGIEHVILAGVPLVSLDGIRDYLQRHTYFDQTGTSGLRPVLLDLRSGGVPADPSVIFTTGQDHE